MFAMAITKNIPPMTNMISAPNLDERPTNNAPTKRPAPSTAPNHREAKCWLLRLADFRLPRRTNSDRRVGRAGPHERRVEAQFVVGGELDDDPMR